MSNGVNQKRPKLEIPLTGAEKIFEIFAGIGVVVNLILTASYWNKLPARFATHFDFSGNPNGWGGKGTLVFLPILLIFLYLVFLLLEKYPESYNYAVEINDQNAEKQYKNSRSMLIILKAELVCLFTYIQWTVIRGALAGRLALGPWFILIVMVVLFATVGYFVYRSVKSK